jgi:hypothetical protein
MGYGNYMRTPMDVQADTQRKSEFETIKNRYESIKPIQGKRKALNIRPVGERRRDWEQVIKISDTEYTIVFDAWKHSNRTPNRAITWSLNDGIETITVHTPKTLWKDSPELYPKYLSSASTFGFYHFNLPMGLNMVNNNACKYVALTTETGNQYYTLEKGDITFTRKLGSVYWNPLVVHREATHLLDRTKTKEVRLQTKPLLDYLKIMVDLVEPKYLGYWQNPITYICKNLDLDEHDVFKQVGDDTPEHWFLLAEHYKHLITDERYDWTDRQNPQVVSTMNKEKLPKLINKHSYALFKPVKEIEVPLGQMCKDRYKSWFK